MQLLLWWRVSSSALPNQQPRVDNVVVDAGGGMVGAKILRGGRRIQFCVNDDDDHAKSGAGAGGGGYRIVMEDDDDVSSFITTIVVIIISTS